MDRTLRQPDFEDYVKLVNYWGYTLFTHHSYLSTATLHTLKLYRCDVGFKQCLN